MNNFIRSGTHQDSLSITHWIFFKLIADHLNIAHYTDKLCPRYGFSDKELWRFSADLKWPLTKPETIGIIYTFLTMGSHKLSLTCNFALLDISWLQGFQISICVDLKWHMTSIKKNLTSLHILRTLYLTFNFCPS